MVGGGEVTNVSGRSSVLFKAGWISLLLSGAAILVFGLIVVTIAAGNEAPYFRAVGVASIGMGLFGAVITITSFRRRERWAWFASWYYPVFWAAHLAGNLPPGKDHVHQVVFIVLSLAGLLLPIREFFPGRKRGSIPTTP